MYAFENHYFVQFTWPKDFIALALVLTGSILDSPKIGSERFELFEKWAL